MLLSNFVIKLSDFENLFQYINKQLKDWRQ